MVRSEVITIVGTGHETYMFIPYDSAAIGPKRPITELRGLQGSSILPTVDCPMLEPGGHCMSVVDGFVQPGHESCPAALLAQQMKTRRMLCHRPLSKRQPPYSAAQTMRGNFVSHSALLTSRVLNRIFPGAGNCTDFKVISYPVEGQPGATNFNSDKLHMHALACGKDEQIMQIGEPVMSIHNGEPCCGIPNCALRAQLIKNGVTEMVCAKTRPGKSDIAMVNEIAGEGYFDP